MDDVDDSQHAEPEPARTRRSPAMLATAIALPVAVVVCFVVFAVLARGAAREQSQAAEIGHVKPVAAPDAGAPACGALLGALPDRLGDYVRDGTTTPTGFAQWVTDSRGIVEVRCGTERPAELTNTASLQVINGVQWISAVPVGAPAPTGGAYWTAVDHRPYVTLWVPDDSGTAAVQAVSDGIREQLEPASLDLQPN